MDKNSVMPGNRYRNLKTGKIYQVVGFSTDSETLERRVEYVRVLDRVPLPGEEQEEGADTKWSRPLDLFAEKFDAAF